MAETVKYIEGFPGYAVTDNGVVITSRTNGSSRRQTWGEWDGTTWTIVPQNMNTCGYPQAGLYCRNGSQSQNQRTIPVHRLVATAFHGPAPRGTQCAHLNGNRSDNRASNLAWVTCSENNRHKIFHGTMARGERHGHATLTEEVVRSIRATCLKTSDLAKFLGLNKSGLYQARSGASWSHLQEVAA